MRVQGFTRLLTVVVILMIRSYSRSEEHKLDVWVQLKHIYPWKLHNILIIVCAIFFKIKNKILDFVATLR